MTLPTMEYLVAFKGGFKEPLGFTSFMDTEEEGLNGYSLRRVIYCYELQVCSKVQGKGIGSILLDELERVSLERLLKPPLVMLTCFKFNLAALKFYYKRGYIPDETCPSKQGSFNSANPDDGDSHDGHVHYDYEILIKEIQKKC